MPAPQVAHEDRSSSCVHSLAVRRDLPRGYGPCFASAQGRGGFACDLTAGLTPTAVLLPLPSAALGGGP